MDIDIYIYTYTDTDIDVNGFRKPYSMIGSAGHPGTRQGTIFPDLGLVWAISGDTLLPPTPLRTFMTQRTRSYQGFVDPVWLWKLEAPKTTEKQGSYILAFQKPWSVRSWSLSIMYYIPYTIYSIPYVILLYTTLGSLFVSVVFAGS